MFQHLKLQYKPYIFSFKNGMPPLNYSSQIKSIALSHWQAGINTPLDLTKKPSDRYNIYLNDWGAIATYGLHKLTGADEDYDEHSNYWVFEQEYFYDKHQRLDKIVTQQGYNSKKGIETKTTEYRYDENGNQHINGHNKWEYSGKEVVKSTNYYSEKGEPAEIDEIIEFEYDVLGRIIKIHEYGFLISDEEDDYIELKDEGLQLLFIQSWEYTTRPGKIIEIKETVIDIQENTTEIRITLYDAFENIISDKKYNHNGTQVTDYSYQYVYDGYGNWLKCSKTTTYPSTGEHFLSEVITQDIRYR